MISLDEARTIRDHHAEPLTFDSWTFCLRCADSWPCTVYVLADRLAQLLEEQDGS